MLSINFWLPVVIYIILAPIAGGLLAGIDRKITARMQGRYGPPLLQPFYDVFKLWQKETIVVNSQQRFYILAFFIFIIITGAIFCAGGDLLLAVFALTLAEVFLVLGAYSTYSPYAHIGAERELMQMMAYEPMVILTIVGMYMVTGSFNVAEIIAYDKPIILGLPLIFLGFLFILTIKLRKSPFDISMSHHAHQEIVRGVITEFTGRDLAMIEISHWYENIFLLGLLYLFFSFNPLIAVVVILAGYLLEVYIDNANARLKWQFMLGSTWMITLLFALVNMLILLLC